MTQNYQLVYYDAENVGIIGILTYPKIYMKHLPAFLRAWF